MRRILRSRWLQSFIGVRAPLLGGVVWEFGPLLPRSSHWLPRLLVIQSMLVVPGRSPTLLLDADGAGPAGSALIDRADGRPPRPARRRRRSVPR